MNGDINIDVGTAIATAVERTLGLFGHDQVSRDLKSKLDKHIRTATELASTVQIIGMDRPIPLSEIYLPTKLAVRGERDYNVMQLLDQDGDALILGGPGLGKTTLLHWIYLYLLENPSWIPILFTLRWSSVSRYLMDFVKLIAPRKDLRKKRKARIALLVDGYDEIPARDRSLVSEALREFASLKVGKFYLTCRLFYDVYDLKVQHFLIRDFVPEDALTYVRKFSSLYNADIDATYLLQELADRGLSDFTNNPLLLALVCILKSGPMPTLPKNTIGLIRRAIDTLTLRWGKDLGTPFSFPVYV